MAPGVVVESYNIEVEDITQAFESRLSELAGCYGLVSTSRLKGEVVVRALWDADGRLQRVLFPQATEHDPVFEGCLAKVVETMSFSGAGEFSYELWIDSVKAAWWTGAGQPVAPVSIRAPEVLVQVGELGIQGPLEEAKIRPVIEAGLPALRECYQSEQRQNPELKGKLVIRFVIARNGYVAHATTRSSTLNNPVVESCFNQQLLRLYFSETTDSVLVTVPFQLSVAEEGAEEAFKAPEPVVETPKAPEPVVEAPETSEPVVKAPKAPEPVVEAPETSEPVVETPKAPEPVVEVPKAPEPLAEVPSLMLVGVFDKATIDAEVRRHMPALRQCMSAIPEDEPVGKVSVTFEVGPYGSVVAAEVLLGNPILSEVESCMEAELLTMRFPPPPSGTIRIAYPF